MSNDPFRRFCETIAALRHPETGCPWDLEQDHKTLRRFMLEEAYEAVEAMTEGVDASIADELGDVLLQVVLNAQVAADRGAFTIDDVVTAIDEKMRRRHPHVFDNVDGVNTSGEVKAQWDEIKAQEKAAQPKPESLFRKFLSKAHPATAQAYAIGKQAKKVRFDWDHVDDVFRQLRSEIDELEAALKNSNSRPTAAVEDELGDVFFSWAHVCRHLGLDPEIVAWQGNKKFVERFERMQRLAAERDIDWENADLEELWVEAKRSLSPDD